MTMRAIAPPVPFDRFAASAVPLHKGSARNPRQLAIGGQPGGSAQKPSIIVGAFGLIRAERMAYEREGAVVLDLESRFILRSLVGCVTGICLSRSLFRIALLLSMVPCVAVHAEVQDQLWGDREDGGPDSLKSIDAHILRLRRRLAPLGLVIKTEWGIGFELCDARAMVEALP